MGSPEDLTKEQLFEVAGKDDTQKTNSGKASSK